MNFAKKPLSRSALLASTAMVAALSVSPALAETWNGSSGPWGNAANWTPASVPNAVDAVANFNAIAGTSAGVFLTGGPFTVGTLNLNNAVGGGYSFQNGTLVMEASGGGTANIQVETENFAPDFRLGGLLQLNSNTVVDTIGGATFRVDTAIGGAGGLTKTGTGTMTLSAANTYGGGTTVSAGTLEINNSSALGTGAVTLDGGTLRSGTSTNVNNLITFGTGKSSTLSAAAGTTLTLGGQVQIKPPQCQRSLRLGD